MTPPIERLEGKYEILEKLGEGGMGAVYKVRHVLLDEVRVVKVLRSALQGDEGLEARFEREARVATQLRHPNVAQLHDFTLDETGNAFIVLEYIEGLTLEELLKRFGPPPLGLTLEIARQSLKAIGYLHRKNFVHRDISPDNLMLARDVDGRPLVKLIDLGIAKLLEGDPGLTATGMFLGKVRYASPERLDETVEQLDGRSDLYSFGVVLYELLTGRRPIDGSTPPAIIAGHLFRPPLDFEDTDPEGRVPDELRAIVMRALAKNRDERVADARTFSRELGTLQRAFPANSEESRRAFDAIAAVFGEERPPSPVGSTQGRLNRQFGPQATPARRPRTPPEPTVATAIGDPAPTERVAEPPRGAPDAVAQQAPAQRMTEAVPDPPIPAMIVAEADRRPATKKVWTPLIATAAVLGIALGWVAISGGPVRPPPVEGGLLILDASPWGRVTAIRDREGEPVDLPEQPFTPFVLRLPAGDYQVELGSVQGVEPKTFDVRVAAGETQPVRIIFSEVSSGEFFDSLGF